MGVHRGLMTPMGRFATERIDYSVEADVPAGLDVREAIRDLEALVEAILEEKRWAIQALAQQPTRLDPKALDWPALAPVREQEGRGDIQHAPEEEQLLAELSAAKGGILTRGIIATGLRTGALHGPVSPREEGRVGRGVLRAASEMLAYYRAKPSVISPRALDNEEAQDELRDIQRADPRVLQAPRELRRPA